jgi:FixJ family two-component response regulator
VAVIIVEDDSGVSDALQVLARELGHEVRAYPDGESFFTSPLPQPGDIVIVDILLPGISGFHVIRWLEGLAAPPRVIAISGQPHGALARQLEAGISAPLYRKPLSAAVLQSVL